MPTGLVPLIYLYTSLHPLVMNGPSHPLSPAASMTATLLPVLVTVPKIFEMEANPQKVEERPVVSDAMRLFRSMGVARFVERWNGNAHFSSKGLRMTKQPEIRPLSVKVSVSCGTVQCVSID